MRILLDDLVRVQWNIFLCGDSLFRDLNPFSRIKASTNIAEAMTVRMAEVFLFLAGIVGRYCRY